MKIVNALLVKLLETKNLKTSSYLDLDRFISYLNDPYNSDIPEEFMKEPTNTEKVYETFCGT